ncbi:MAG: lytic transglycosylase domain-containing protein [Deltaproteobacteria bacterium]|nr:lytic transglycosylase domain-containing protein [Deltaproteobacteria bacterium]
MSLITGPTKLGLIVYLAFLASLCLAVAPAADRDPVDGVQAAISRLLRPVPRHRLRRDETALRALSEDIVATARKYRIDEYLLTAMAYCESTFRPTARGSLGERGLVQVGRGARQGCDLTTDRGQLECGASWLRKGIERCGSLKGGLTAYATGRCSVSPGTKAEWVVHRRLKMARELREKFGG